MARTYTADDFGAATNTCRFWPMARTQNPKGTRRDPELGKRIRALRDSLNETQDEFGARFEVEQATVSRWERGSLPERKYLGPLADLAGLPEADFVYAARDVRVIPVVSWVAASTFTDMVPVRESDVTGHLTIGDLPTGDYFALDVRGDSMDRIAPDGSKIIVDRHKTDLVHKKFYVFLENRSTTFKRAMLKPTLRLEPFSHSYHEPIFPEDPSEVIVLGRVVRVILDV